MIDIGDIKQEDLPHAYQEIAKIIGFEAVLKLGQEFGGQQLYLPKLDGVLTRISRRKILEELKTHTGSISTLARKHKLSFRTVYDIIEAEHAKNTKKTAANG